ncbi:MAG TPA: c-type cytochrome [Gemmatimonadota bacterium]|nr:c-type cytochrome [Gemmatimonadota bacterium]
MRWTVVLAAFVPCFLVTAGPAIAQEEPEGVPDSVTPARVLAGSNLYNGGSCVACHAVAGRGSGTRAPDLADVEWLHSAGDFDGIFQTIFWGVPKDRVKAMAPRPFEMHPRGGMNVDREQMKALAAYVWTMSRPSTHTFVVEQARFLAAARGGRTAEAVDLFRQSRMRDPEHLLLPENALNRLGYEFLPGDPDTAIALFELNVESHPGSSNVYDSLGEAYMVKGDRERAISNYERSLELDSGNENAIEKLRELRAD